MDGAHDLGGKHGFGAIDRSQQEHFPRQWEQSVFALTLACGLQGKWNLDQSRSAREQMNPAHYLSSSYYEHWLYGLEFLLLDKGLVSHEELDSGVADPAHSFVPVARDRVRGMLEKGGSTLLESEVAALYQIGDMVEIHHEHPSYHTRVPGYIRGRTGKIILYHGAHIFPDTHAVTGEKEPQHLYTVQFDSAELWGHNSCEANSRICVDVFEPYIEKKIGQKHE